MLEFAKDQLMRRLLIVPIIHSQTDLGSLTETVNATKELALGTEKAHSIRRTIQEFWESLKSALQAMDLPFQKLLVYQDGLPVVENATLQIERQIVNELAQKGSPNHRLVAWLMEQGAGLVGTESPDLLMKEYAAIRKSLESGFAASRLDDTSDESRSTQAQPTLLDQRDQFIAARIDQTLGDEQIGVLFIGMAHRVEHYLADDIEVTFPVGRPLALAASSPN